MDKQEIERKIIEIARMVSEQDHGVTIYRLSGRLQVLFKILDALNQEVKR